MEIKNYFLKLKNKELVSNSDLYFYEGKINPYCWKKWCW